GRRNSTLDRLRVRGQRRVRCVDPASDRPLILPPENAGQPEGRNWKERRSARYGRKVNRVQRSTRVGHQRLPGEIIRKVHPTEVAQNGVPRVGEPGRAVPERAEIVGAGDECASAPPPPSTSIPAPT